MYQSPYFCDAAQGKRSRWRGVKTSGVAAGRRGRQRVVGDDFEGGRLRLRLGGRKRQGEESMGEGESKR